VKKRAKASFYRPGRLLGWDLSSDGKRLRLRFAAASAEVTLSDAGVVRIRAVGGAKLGPDIAAAVVREPIAESAIEADAVGNDAVFGFPGVEIRLRNATSAGASGAPPWEDLRIVVRERSDSTFLVEARLGDARTLFAVDFLEFSSSGGARFSLVTGLGAFYFGFGEKTGPMGKANSRLSMRTRDLPVREGLDPLYAAIPFFLWAIPAHKVLPTQATQVQVAERVRRNRLEEDARADQRRVKTFARPTHAFFGLLLECFAPSHFDVAAAFPDRVLMETEAWGADLTVFFGPDPKQVLTAYARRTGLAALPPLWSLGYHQSRWSYDTQAEVLSIASEFRRRGIPLDAIHLDIDYMDGYRVFTWDPRRFPDPKGMCETLADLGVRAVCIVDPGIKVDPGYDIYRKAVSGGHICLADDGTPATMWVWPRKGVFCDFNRPSARRFWGELHERLLAVGISGIWNDMNEPAGWRFDVRLGRKLILPLAPQDTSRMRQTDPLPLPERNEDQPTWLFPRPASVPTACGQGQIPHEAVRNIYAYQECRALSEYLEQEHPDKRYFILTRSGYAGIQRFAAMWTGDIASRWRHLGLSLRMLLGLSVSGVGFCGADIGGFIGRCMPELYARWIQSGVFYPFCRTHTQGLWGRQEPWSFGSEVEDIARRYIKLRMSLLPYIYSVFEEFARSGIPPLRPLFLEYPNDPDALCVEDEAFFGPHLLIAPVLEKGATGRSVYFPAGEWIQLGPAGLPLHVEAALGLLPGPAPCSGRQIAAGQERNRTVVGPRRTEVQAPLWLMPYFARAGSVIFWQRPVSSTEEVLSGKAGPLLAQVFLGSRSALGSSVEGPPSCKDEGGEANLSYYYEDDGLSNDYKAGAFLRVGVEVGLSAPGQRSRSHKGSHRRGYFADGSGISVSLRASSGEGSFKSKRAPSMFVVWLPTIDGKTAVPERLSVRGKSVRLEDLRLAPLLRSAVAGDPSALSELTDSVGLGARASGKAERGSRRLPRCFYDKELEAVLVPWSPGVPIEVDILLKAG
jgi:alpha-glucosidase (family GH31 glycosyl hydrolase)